MDEILALEDQRIEAMTNGDVETLEKILADDLIYTHTTASLDTKASFIDAVKTGKSSYKSVERKDVEVRQFGDTAVVTGHANETPSWSARSRRAGGAVDRSTTSKLRSVGNSSSAARIRSSTAPSRATGPTNPKSQS